jgi:hypothetical protein
LTEAFISDKVHIKTKFWMLPEASETPQKFFGWFNCPLVKKTICDHQDLLSRYDITPACGTCVATEPRIAPQGIEGS